jgi:large conductance mechanosensitive channel
MGRVLKGFAHFILRGNVVDLAVAVVVGAAFGSVVSSFVADLLTPLIAAIGGQPDFSSLTFKVHHSEFRYGHFINAVLSFLLVAAAVYFAVVLPLSSVTEKRARAATPQPPASKPEEVQLLAQIRDLLERPRSPSPH